MAAESRGRFEVAMPVLVVALVLGGLIAIRLGTYHGNVTGLIQFGSLYVHYTNPPHGAVVGSPMGYDGQFFWVQARDPLIVHDRTIAEFPPGELFRIQRLAYPLLAFVLAVGQRSAIPWSLLAVNVLAVLAVTAVFAAYARRRGWPPAWSIAVGLMPGLVAGTLRDLSDPLAVACMLAALICWQRDRRWSTAALLSVAALAREPMMLAVLAVAVDAAVRWWRTRTDPGALRRIVGHTWPAVLVPLLVFVAWQIYIDARYGGNVAGTSTSPFTPPFVNFVDEVRRALDRTSGLSTVWDLVYIALMLLGILAAIALAARKLTATSVAAMLFAITLLVLTFGDDWSYTRLSAPLFATLLLSALELGGVERRSRLPRALCVTAAIMSVLIPAAL